MYILINNRGLYEFWTESYKIIIHVLPLILVNGIRVRFSFCYCRVFDTYNKVSVVEIYSAQRSFKSVS